MSASDKKKLRKEQESAALTEKQLAQKKADKQLKNYTLTFIVVMVLVVAIAVGSMGIGWYNNSGIPARGTVAVTIGDTTMSNVDLNYYFIDYINNFYGDAYDQYGSYASLYISATMGLDMTQPLSAQIYNTTTGETWADYFVDCAINSAKSTYALYDKAMSGGEYELPEDFETQVNASLASTKALAGYYGFSSMEAYIKAMYGNGATVESYEDYFRINAIAESYYTDCYRNLQYTDEDIETYNAEHYNEFSTFEYSYFYIPVTKYYPETEEGVEVTDDEKAAAVISAKEAADALAKATDLENLNALISILPFATETTDAEVIDGTALKSIPELYREWIADSARVPGNISVFEYESDSDKDENVDGYYVVLFQGREDNNTLLRSVRHILVKFEGGKVENGKTVYTDEEKATAKAAAEKIYNDWLNGGELTNETFAAMVTTETSDDSGSNTNGGLYENVYVGQMVTNFNDWVYDPARQPGDHGIIETEIGYHIMFFVEEQDNTYREYLIEYTLRNTDINKWYEDLIKTVTVTEGDTSYINKAIVIASASAS